MSMEDLGASRSFLRQFMEAVPGAVYAKDLKGRVLLGNAGFGEAVGWVSGGFVGKSDLELLRDEDLARVIMENDRRIMAEGVKRQVEEELRASDGSTSCWLSTKAPFTDEAGNVAGLVGVSIDITERKRLEERERLLARELEHRNKNLLGVVQSVIRLTNGNTPEDLREAVLGRLAALNRAQSILARERRRKVELRTLVLEELSAYDLDDSRRVRLTGPPVLLAPSLAQPLAMALHELATNAAKYGAFADASGALDLSWECPEQEGDLLRLEWKERREAPTTAPLQHGFGTRLIRSLVEQQLRGTLEVEWEPTGLRCRIAFPLELD